MYIILDILTYADIALLAALAVVAAVYYSRYRDQGYALIACGAGLWAVGWLAGVVVNSGIFFADAPDPYIGTETVSLPMSIFAEPALEFAAVALWALALCWRDNIARIRVIVFFVFSAFVAMLMTLLSSADQGLFYTSILYAVLQAGLIIYALHYTSTRQVAGRHYFIQAFLFLLVAFCIPQMISALGPSAGGAVSIFRLTAIAFAAVSLILYTDTTAAAVLQGRVRLHQRIARIFEIVPELKERFHSLPDTAEWEDRFTRGIELIAQSLEDDFGFRSIYIGRPEDRREFLRLDSYSVGPYSDSAPASVELLGPIVAEVTESGRTALVTQADSDPRILNDPLESTAMNSFALVPFSTNSIVSLVLLVGGKIDGTPLDENDATLLDVVADRVPAEFTRAGAETGARAFAPGGDEIDSITRLLNFSSFQKLLGEQMEEADKNSGRFALLLFDTDHFSAVNEKLGYQRGDQILKDIGERISRYTSPGRSGRVGADEFAFLLPVTGEDFREEVERILSEMNDNMHEICEEASDMLSMSAAYSIYPFDFVEQTGVFGKMREILAAGGSSARRVVRVKVG